MIIHFCFGLSRLDLFNFLLKLSSSLLHSLFPVSYLSTFLINFFFSLDDIIFTSLELTLISRTNFGDKRADVASGRIDLLSQFINLNSFFQLLLQIVLLIFKQLSLVFQVLLILHFSILDVHLVQLLNFLFGLFQSVVFIDDQLFLFFLVALSFREMFLLGFFDFSLLVLSL